MKKLVTRAKSIARIVELLETRSLFCADHFGDAEAMAREAYVERAVAATMGLLTSTDTPTAQSTPAFVRRFSFQPDGSTPVPDFHRVDTGAPYGLRSNGLTYGWSADNRDGRDRNQLDDQRYDTFHHFQKNGANYSWEFAVPNGQYTVRVVAGDPGYFDSVFKVNVEGTLAVNATPTTSNRFAEGTVTVNVTDGRLTISNATGAKNNKIAFVEIVGGSNRLPVVSVAASDASAGESNNPGTFTLSRTGSTAGSLIVNYAVSGTATNGSDYTLLSGQAIFAAGSATTSILVSPIDDTLVESNETVSIALTTAMDYSNAFNSSATITIADNDTAPTPTPNPALGTLKWTTKANNPVARAEGFGAVFNGKFYTFGGYLNSQYRPSKVAHVYNPATNQWTQLNDAPLELTHAATAQDDRFMYVAGGYPPGAQGPTGPQAFATNKAFVYDSSNDSWSTLPNLPQARGSGQMVLIGRTLHFFGGSDAARKDKAEHWSLNLDNTAAGWATKASMPAARNHFGAVALDGLIYAVGGQTGQDASSVFKSDVFRYNPSTNTWTSVKSLTSARSHANASTIAHKGRIIIIGGEITGATLNKVEAYNPATNSWSTLTNLPKNITAGIAASLGDTIIMSTGGSGFRADTWIGAFI
ncbi:MAG TPA: kelch repeat-containing protein [Tepidisphaeraceae bacterium]|nr:kelch repeat-containing protein [Tepidisphaeraceae bacterium]